MIEEVANYLIFYTISDVTFTLRLKSIATKTAFFNIEQHDYVGKCHIEHCIFIQNTIQNVLIEKYFNKPDCC